MFQNLNMEQWIFIGNWVKLISQKQMSHELKGNCNNKQIWDSFNLFPHVNSMFHCFKHTCKCQKQCYQMWLFFTTLDLHQCEILSDNKCPEGSITSVPSSKDCSSTVLCSYTWMKFIKFIWSGILSLQNNRIFR